jgi:ATP-binding cassette subfamily B (MDR/TAP) protein 9
MRTTGLLLVVAAACGLFTGIRGGLFSVAMTRLNVRLRRALFSSLLQQEIGFYDTIKTGGVG